jgi:hypothetical protein
VSNITNSTDCARLFGELRAVTGRIEGLRTIMGLGWRQARIGPSRERALWGERVHAIAWGWLSVRRSGRQRTAAMKERHEGGRALAPVTIEADG